MLKIQQVRQLVIAAETGSFKAAAESTFRSQAAVSTAMRELEREIGGRLLERVPRDSKFTPLALALLPLLRQLLTVHDSVLAQSRELASGRQGSVEIAVAPFLAADWLSGVIAQVTRASPDIRIRTLEERSSRIRELVADGSVDIGVAGVLDDDPRLAITPVARDSYGVLCSRGHPLARRRSTSWRSLRDERLIGSDALDALASAGLVPRGTPAPSLVVTSRAPLLACVRRNLGIAIMPMLTRPEPREGFAFVALTRPTLARTVSIVTPRGESLLPATQRLAAMLTESLRVFAARRGAPLVAGEPR